MEQKKDIWNYWSNSGTIKNIKKGNKPPSLERWNDGTEKKKYYFNKKNNKYILKILKF